MNGPTPRPPLTVSIAAAERDTGLSKDTLRIWERRYGFPTPGRDADGERAYPVEQIEKLRLVKRLMDAGHRPGRIVALALADLQAISETRVEPAIERDAGAAARVDLQPFLDLVRRHDPAALRAALRRQLIGCGLARFVTDVIAPLNTAVGDAWFRGQLEVYEEHLYTEAVQVVLRQALAMLPDADADARPLVLLTTFPGEPHGLGLLMAEAMLAVEGAACLSLGVQTPLWDIVLAAAAQRSQIVAIGFTACLNPNQVVDGLAELRAKLPATVALWAGGSSPVLLRRRIDGVLPLALLDEVPAALRQWRANSLVHGTSGDD